MTFERKMALEIKTNAGEIEEEEEDAAYYFLQPASSPYNINEKVQQANHDLFNSTSQQQQEKQTKVKFREALVSFEPDLTDDDVNSIESDVADDISVVDLTATGYFYGDYSSATLTNDSDEEIRDVLVDEEAINDEEEIDSEKVTKDKRSSNDDDNENGKKKAKKKSKVKRQRIDCKRHCIENVDAQLSMSIKKLEIREKIPNFLPPLQLHRRPCCPADVKLTGNLPEYKGHRSEYGLTARQIKNRDRHLNRLRQKETIRQKLLEEYRVMKVQQNERVFCQWLRQVSKRRVDNNNPAKIKFRPKTTPSSCIDSKLKSNCQQDGNNYLGRKRPCTARSCSVFIQLSSDLLNKGISIGDLLITDAKALNKKFNILAVS